MGSQGFDVLVIGGGHAGAEAAWAAAQLGARTALVTFQRQAIGRMSCNPAIGGIGKGQIVREIDALGGLMGLVADETGIQFRMLNRTKGPAVWSPRCQSDRELYAAAVQRHLEGCPNLTMIESGVETIEVEECGTPRNSAIHNPQSTINPQSAIPTPKSTPRRITGVVLSNGERVRATTIVVTSGTFLRALMHCGEEKTPGGRVGEAAATGLSASLKALGLELGRLKTGTPPRIARDSIDFSQLTEQPGDDPPVPFSYMTERITTPQVCCWITHTNPAVHDLIRANLHRAPMYSGQIESRGPRYCPSIEDKVVRFADKTQHQLFLEPEGRDSERIYINGISTSLPQDVQAGIVARIAGLERARVLQWGYAVEYDFVPPQQIDASLMVKTIAGLFLAGQINGTSGYEEAAGQGLMAGINAARHAAGRPPVNLRRDQAYIGVMIDDLVTRGVLEPYRMFTSRAEHRLHLRYDNADARLTPIGREIGLANAARWARFERKRRRLLELQARLATLRIGNKPAIELLRRPEETGAGLLRGVPELREFDQEPDVWASALVDAKYAGYVQRQERLIERQRTLEDRAIPAEFDYAAVAHLPRETVERWSAVRPATVGQASRVTGVRATDVSLLVVELMRSPKPVPGVASVNF